MAINPPAYIGRTPRQLVEQAVEYILARGSKPHAQALVLCEQYANGDITHEHLLSALAARLTALCGC